MNPKYEKNFHAKLDALFNPGAVAVIGASENPDKLGFHVMKSLTSGGFSGHIVPVNPGAEEIMGIPAFPSIADFRDPIDLAVIVVPAKLVPDILNECIGKDVKGIVLITAGFKEIHDPGGGQLQELLAKKASDAGIPVIGPNTFGMINLHKNLNASFTPEFSSVERGGITLVSQSGGISHLTAFMAMKAGLRMSKIVGLGNRLNVDFADMLFYLAEDPDTKVIALYIEGLDNPRRLLEAGKSIKGKKPVLALKAGTARTGDQASLSHTGSLAGKHKVYQGALSQAGFLSVDSTEGLLDLANALCLCPMSRGPGVAVLTGQAGPGMIACDVCEGEGLKIVSFESETQKTINDLLPPLALRTNPVDMGPAWYDASAIQGIVRAVMEDKNVDGILLLMMFASANRDAVPKLSGLLMEWNQKKPLITCLIAPPGIWDEDLLRLEKAGAILNMPTPERAAKAMAGLWKYSLSLGIDKNVNK